MRVYESIVIDLLESGVRVFSGMAGSVVAPYVSELVRHPEARYVAVRHEHVAASILDAVGRLSGTPGCLLTHGASGILAASLGVAAAGLDNTPLVLVSGTQERKAMENGGWQTADVMTPISEYAKWQSRVERPDRARTAVARAVATAVDGRPGVTQVDVPIDVASAVGEGPDRQTAPQASTPVHRGRAPEQMIDDIAVRLAESQRPVILVGADSAYSGAGAAVTKLAERVHAPVVASQHARGLVPERSSYGIGPSGILGYEPARETIAQSDLILAIGSTLSDIELGGDDAVASDVSVIQVHSHPDLSSAVVDVDTTVQADPTLFAEELLTRVDAWDAEVDGKRRTWAEGRLRAAAEWREDWLQDAPDNGLVQPQEVVAALCAQLPPDAILTHGAGDHSFYGGMVPVDGPGTHLMSVRLGAMGCAVGFAMGAKIARPDQITVACVGDGEFVLQLGDLETLAREEFGVVVVVFNNFRLGSQRQRMATYGDIQGIDHGNPDFAALAELHGCRGFVVDEPGQFAGVLGTALASGQPSVIDVRVDPDARPPRIDKALARAEASAAR